MPSSPTTHGRRTTAELAKSLFRNSYITGFPQIARAEGAVRKVKILFFALCTLGFLYQAQQFSRIFFLFPVTMVIDVEYPKGITTPAMTICSGNSIHLTKYCSHKPDHCNGSHTLLPEYQNLEEQPIMEEAFKKYGIPWSDIQFTLTARWIESDIVGVHDVLRFPLLDSKGKSTVCYVVNHQIRMPNESVLEIPTTENSLYAYMLNTINVFMAADPRIVIDPSKKLAVSFHSPFELSNPYNDGIMMKGGVQNLVIYKLVETHRLPPPYQTMCEDYLSEWKKNHSKPLNKNSCIQECISRKIATACQCHLIGVLYWSDLKFCSNDQTNCTDEIVVDDCYENCLQECKSLVFNYIIVEKQFEKSYAIFEAILKLTQRSLDISNLTSFDQISGFHLAIDNEEKIIYKYKPKYETIEMFGYLGGYVGVWLGTSLIAFFDLFETMFLVLYFHLTASRKAIGSHLVQPFPAAGEGLA